MPLLLEQLTRRDGRYLEVNQLSLEVNDGAIAGVILAEMTVGQHDLLVLGAPLPGHDGRSVLAGVVSELLRTAANHAILLVRSPESVARHLSL